MLRNRAETGGLLSITWNVGHAIGSMILIDVFFVALALQLFSKKVHPPIYWLVIVATGIAGRALGAFLADSSRLGDDGARLTSGLLILVILLILDQHFKSRFILDRVYPSPSLLRDIRRLPNQNRGKVGFDLGRFSSCHLYFSNQ